MKIIKIPKTKNYLKIDIITLEPEDSVDEIL
ncbi:hypothetical protein Rh054_07135 [Rickettsia conorii subsp. heilongjiangensis 054]|uniref:Uncharacterized protein n=1 Tax=Rickettsia argasii T170-B TaxID=1268837 RepID=A0A0F3REI4_9RICK|nr:hypothetical protein Rh054_07135 [Rickettsia conorii subsp. heilongjiangensis 054]KJW04658.1 hypothetical protein RAT170B_0975 [Rickettsia argasii T170-B]